MSVDNNYQNNLVITEDAFQELLTNIKNFPIIDIEYIAPNQTENGNNIWQTHNNGKPCLRVTYGNLDHKTYIFQDPDDAESYKQLQTELKQLKLIRAKCNYVKSKFEKAWENNVDLLKEQVDLYKSGIPLYTPLDLRKQKVLELIMTFISNALFSFSGLEETQQITKNIKFSWDIVQVNRILGERTETIPIKLFSDNNGTQSIYISFLHSNQQELGLSESQIKFIEDFIKHYNELTLINKFNERIIKDTIENTEDLTEYTTDNILEAIGNPSKVIPYLNFPIGNYSVENLNDALEQLYDASTSKIKDNLNLLNSYIIKLKEIIDYLDGISNGTDDNSIEVEEHFIYAIRIPELRSYLQIEISRSGLDTFYFVFNKSIPALKSDIEILEAKESNTILEGISYVDVGDQIAFENNFPIPTGTATNANNLLVNEEQEQKSGTFRIDINDKTYEVPIRGFTAQENTQPVVIKSSNSIELNSADIKSTSITPLTVNESLGSQNTPWADIYVKDLHVSASDDGDKTTKFLREDGRWSNELTDKLVLGHVTSQGESQTNKTCLLVQNETEAMRKIENKPAVSYTPVTDLSAIGTITYYEDADGTNPKEPIPARYEFTNIITEDNYVIKFLKSQDKTKSEPIITSDINSAKAGYYIVILKNAPQGGTNTYYVWCYDEITEIENLDEKILAIKIPKTGQIDFEQKPTQIYPIHLDAMSPAGDGLTTPFPNGGDTYNGNCWWDLGTVSEIYNKEDRYKDYITLREEQPAGAYAKFSNFSDANNTYYYKDENGEYKPILKDNTTNNTTEIFYATNGIFIQKQETISEPDPAAGYFIGSEGTYSGSIVTYGGIAAGKSIKAAKVHGAVFNDYAEYRHTDSIAAGRCVIETGKGDLILSSQRLQLGANITTDTFGFSIGETNYANTPIAVCGRVLAYPYEDCINFTPGAAVCSGPNGTISVMSREEIRNWPDAIIGYVSEIPTYDKWGSDQIDVNGRIWIKIK